MVDPYFAALNMRELNNQFAFVDDPLLSKEEREQGIRDGLMQLEQAIGERLCPKVTGCLTTPPTFLQCR